MQKASRWLSDISKDLAPLSLISAGTVNIILFYFGAHGDDRIRRALFTGAMVVIFCLSVARAIQLFIQTPDHRKRLFALCALPAAIYAGFAVAFAVFGFSRGLLKSLLDSGVFVIPAFVFAVDTAVSHREKELFQRFERWSLVLLPAALLYMMMEISGMNLPTSPLNLGVIDYLSLAYTYMPCLFALSILFLLKPFGEDFSFGGMVKGRIADVARLCLIMLFWTLIVLSGARGAVLSVVGFYLLLFLYQLSRHKPVLKILAVISGVAAVFLILNFAVAIPGMHVTRQRWGIVVDGLKNGRLTAEPEAEIIRKNVDALVKSPGGKKFKQSLVGGRADKPSSPGVAVDEGGPIVRITNRETLYVLAVKEFLKSPLTGMLPLGYFVKYGNYPHNTVLEILCELGLLGLIPLMTFFMLLAGKLLKASQRDITKEAMFILLVGLVLKCMSSGTLWGELNIMFACAYAAAFGSRFIKA